MNGPLQVFLTPQRMRLAEAVITKAKEERSAPLFEMESCKANLLNVTYWVQRIWKGCLPKALPSKG